MRFLVALGSACAGLMIVIVPPAGAEFPLALRASAGPGFGFARKDGIGTGPLAGVAVTDLIWRPRRGRGLALSFDLGGVAFPGGRSYPYPPRRSLDASVHQSVTVGPERHPVAGGTGGVGHWGLGIGRIHEDAGGDSRDFYGVALTAATGLRLIADPGPLGLMFGLRTSHVFAPHMHGHVIAAVIGFVIEPLATNEPVMASR